MENVAETQPVRAEDQLSAVKRAIYLLTTAAEFCDIPGICDEVIDYDEAECDGSCLAADCRISAGELEGAFPNV